jgi:hypothetical protein
MNSREQNRPARIWSAGRQGFQRVGCKNAKNEQVNSSPYKPIVLVMDSEFHLEPEICALL